MESYDEYARRAQIMTEVHALPITDENIPSENDASTSPLKISANKTKEKIAMKKSLKRL